MAGHVLLTSVECWEQTPVEVFTTVLTTIKVKAQS